MHLKPGRLRGMLSEDWKSSTINALRESWDSLQHSNDVSTSVVRRWQSTLEWKNLWKISLQPGD